MLNVLNAILLAAGTWGQEAWAAVAAGGAWLGSLLNHGLSPVLSPLLAWLHPLVGQAAQAGYALLDRGPAWIGLVVISAVTGVVMIVAFKWTSNQRAIRQVRDDIRANLLALRLFKDHLGVALRAQGRLLWALLRLQGRMVLPLLVMLGPMIMLMAQMNRRYGSRSLMPGETALLEVRWPDQGKSPPQVELLAQDAVVVDVGPIGGGGRTVWRLHASATGRHRLPIRLGPDTVDKELVVGGEYTLVSSTRPARQWVGQLLHPGEPPLSSAVPCAAIALDYPPRAGWFTGASAWVWWFFGLSMAAAWLAKSALGVAI